jgi:dihydroxyacetone kinase
VAPATLPQAFDQLAQALMDDIGGSMGPLYGSFFLAFAETTQPHAQLDATLFGRALDAAVQSTQDIGDAKVGDKTLVDTLAAAQLAYREALAANATFALCLQAMSEAAEAGKESTRAMQARVGRSARLGPRSIGVLDAGATSCCLILQSMARTLQRRLSA